MLICSRLFTWFLNLNLVKWFRDFEWATRAHCNHVSCIWGSRFSPKCDLQQPEHSMWRSEMSERHVSIIRFTISLPCNDSSVTSQEENHFLSRAFWGWGLPAIIVETQRKLFLVTWSKCAARLNDVKTVLNRNRAFIFPAKKRAEALL